MPTPQIHEAIHAPAKVLGSKASAHAPIGCTARGAQCTALAIEVT